MAVKKSVRIADEALKTMAALPTMMSPVANYSGAINSMAECFALAVESCQPEMTDGQRMALACCYNGYAPTESLQQELRLLPWHVSEGYQYDEQVADLLGSQETASEFIEMVKAWSDAEKLAAIYFARKFWSDRKPAESDEKE